MGAMPPWNFIHGVKCPHGPHASYATVHAASAVHKQAVILESTVSAVGNTVGLEASFNITLQ